MIYADRKILSDTIAGDEVIPSTHVKNTFAIDSLDAN